jgi:hypothetical protein
MSANGEADIDIQAADEASAVLSNIQNSIAGLSGAAAEASRSFKQLVGSSAIVGQSLAALATKYREAMKDNMVTLQQIAEVHKKKERRVMK